MVLGPLPHPCRACAHPLPVPTRWLCKLPHLSLCIDDVWESPDLGSSVDISSMSFHMHIFYAYMAFEIEKTKRCKTLMDAWKMSTVIEWLKYGIQCLDESLLDSFLYSNMMLLQDSANVSSAFTQRLCSHWLIVFHTCHITMVICVISVVAVNLVQIEMKYINNLR